MEPTRVYLSATRRVGAAVELSADLRAELEAWQDEGEGWIGAGIVDPEPSADDVRAWAAAGELIAGRVSAELGADVYVEYRPRHKGWSGKWPLVDPPADLWSPPPGPPLPAPPPPAGPDVLTATLAVIAREIERIDDPVAGLPGGDPSDTSGWHNGPPGTDRVGPGRPLYDQETWRWFELVDLAYLDEMVIVEFRWTDPSTPLLRYLLFCHVDQLVTPGSAALVVRSQLRSALRPGWRDRLAHHWLSRDRVILLSPKTSSDAVFERQFRNRSPGRPTDSPLTEDSR